MKIKIECEFEVESDEGEVTVGVARAAASQAVYDYLSFCTVSGVNAGRDEAVVHVDGHGECRVRIGEDHDF